MITPRYCLSCYQLPTTLCEMFLKEVFKRGFNRASTETLLLQFSVSLKTTSMFLKHQENFVHRNTLVYRTEKLRNLRVLTFVNLRTLSLFKVALMVKNTLTQVLQYWLVFNMAHAPWFFGSAKGHLTFKLTCQNITKYCII